MNPWKLITSAVTSQSSPRQDFRMIVPEQHPVGVTGRPAILHRPASETELRLLALSIGRATRGA